MSFSSTGVIRPYACHLCSRSFTRPDHLRRHEATHVRPRTLSCPFCAQKFTRLDGLQRH
ncbi:hypothetical protein K432DRAFT_303183, partial [Lepidopterella palustris CBS 459.81]